MSSLLQQILSEAKHLVQCRTRFTNLSKHSFLVCLFFLCADAPPSSHSTPLKFLTQQVTRNINKDDMSLTLVEASPILSINVLSWFCLLASSYLFHNEIDRNVNPSVYMYLLQVDKQNSFLLYPKVSCTLKFCNLHYPTYPTPTLPHPPTRRINIH